MWQFIEKFLEETAKTKIARFKQLPALHSAVVEGNISEVRICLHRKCNINQQDLEGKTPLHYAYKKGNQEIIDILLLCRGINLDIKDNDGHTPMDLTYSTISLLIKPSLEGNMEIVNKLGETLYHENNSN